MAMNSRQVAERRGITEEQVELLHRQRGLTQAAIEELPERSLQRALRRQDYPDAPRARQLFRLRQSVDERGRIPDQPLVGALRELDGLRLRTRRSRVGRMPTGGAVNPGNLAIVPPPVGGLAPQKWKALGPGNIGGRTRSILIHPSNPSTIWAGSVGGGIWRTQDGGQSWSPVDDFLANLAVTSMVMDPNDPDLIYAGTGEGFGNLDALRGGGIFRTIDGTQWSQLASTSGPGWNDINRLALSADGATMLVATRAGIRRSTDAGRALWQTVLAAAVADVKFHPTQPSLAVAGSLSGGASWFSTDGGATWTPSSHSSAWGGRVELCYAVSASQTVFASVDTDGGEIWRSVDGGQSFARRQSLNPDGDPASYLGDQGWYDNVIWAGDPTNPDLVIVGGIDLWRSTDAGDQLVDTSTWWDSRSAHADHHAIVAHPAYDGTTNRIVYFGNDGGVYRADDVTTVGDNPRAPRVNGWTELNNTYAVTQFYGAAGNATTGIIVAGAQDNGTLAYDPATGSEQWTTIFGGDGGFCGADSRDPQIFYGEYVFLNIHRNTDGATTDDLNGDRYITGQFWNAVTRRWDWKPPPFRIPDAFNQRALFIAPFLLDPNESNRILAGGESLWRTNDAQAANTPTSGPSWSRIKPPSNGRISAIAIAPGESDTVWVGYDNGEISRSQNATAANPTWTRVDGPGPNQLRANRFCHQILVSPHDPTTVLIAFGGFTAGNLWRTDDGGATWAEIAGNLPRAPVRAVAVHPTQADWFYIGTEVGVFASEDRGATWSPTNEGPANVSVDDLFWLGERLVCVTHGRGLFEVDLS
jgi:photosystem II stability/assembly factor-like uncharacterized protein